MTLKNLSTGALEMIANRFKILSEPLRLRILHSLRDGEKSVTELTEIISTSQPNISKHLRILQTSGLVRRRQEGNTVYYSIADETIFTLCDVVCGSLETQLRTQAEIFAAV